MSDDSIVRLISADCVPVALDRQELIQAKGQGGDFFRSIFWQDGGAHYQGLWLVTCDGKILTIVRNALGDPGWTRLVLEDLRAGLKRFGSIAPRRATPTNPRPYRGIGIRPDGGVTLAISDKAILVGDLSRRVPPGLMGDLALGSVTLTAAEWAPLAPPDTRAGSRWEVPRAVGGAFFPMLSLRDAKFRHPAEVTDFRLTGRVKSVREGLAYLVYRGQVAGEHEGSRESRKGLVCTTELQMIDGVGVYDVQAGRMLSLTWVWEGLYRAEHKPSQPGRPGRFGVVVEWDRGAPGAAVPRPDAKAPEARPRTAVADSTPEAALKTFLLALAAQDGATLRAVALPDAGLDQLLKDRPAPPDRLAQLKARLDEEQMRRLKAGDPVRMPDGTLRAIKPDDVREGRVVLWPAGELLPARLEVVDGRWRVFAGTFIRARRRAEGSLGAVQAEPVRPSPGAPR